MDGMSKEKPPSSVGSMVVIVAVRPFLATLPFACCWPRLGVQQPWAGPNGCGGVEN